MKLIRVHVITITLSRWNQNAMANDGSGGCGGDGVNIIDVVFVSFNTMVSGYSTKKKIVGNIVFFEYSTFFFLIIYQCDLTGI